MRLRNVSFLTVLLFGLCGLVSVSWYTAFSSSRGDVVDIYQREFLALRERLHSAEQENLRRSKELNLVLEEIKRAIAEKQALRDINRTWSSLSEETRLKLWNVSNSKNVLQLPSIFHHLPHLLNREDSLQPAVHLGQGRTGVSIVMGVPSVKREVHSYLTDTLNSLMSELSPTEKEDCVIVVFIAEADQQYASSVADNLKRLFPAEIQSGLLEVVSPSVHFYPDFSRLRESFGDPKERVRLVCVCVCVCVCVWLQDRKLLFHHKSLFLITKEVDHQCYFFPSAAVCKVRRTSLSSFKSFIHLYFYFDLLS
ncbi:alpha-1,3-mannosyl-glycoprotein 4-beta-N-acetylglucosaminyltransferase B-like [Anarrhichthys ocellatus]|uniref:alpha-1,3-mannosyl-glycoprotein 4-beta-N-acetylglucosaminyltransferase B-like n=1 Tax=Anarrhichthys ocellatus TaxID=433405 RepID=UPI0012ED54FB|nr:alpha-1,3-mannosyl-glycoprotein 4-beta-N-acetylglucosaminyltransferase B-like [Anarrhichthys ocellatus]XP_031732037.1 alpha-1,3-mannosyl-glycoprotein 4-beta-N-acetylglucosaminyltransferase B-like [Anarrhichthys ocellatus]